MSALFTLTPGDISTVEFIEYLCEKRKQGMLELISPPDDGQEAQARAAAHFQAHMEGLINPLCFAAALALAVRGVAAGEDFVATFRRGDAVVGAESFVDVEAFTAPADIVATLAEADNILDRLCVIALRESLVSPKAPLIRNSTHLTMLKQYVATPDAEILGDMKYNVRWVAWHIVNPILQILRPRTAPALPNPRSEAFEKMDSSALLFQYGFAKNSPHHNYREALEARVAQQKQLINEQQKTPGFDLSQALMRLKNDQKLMDRARAFYDWNPAEIDAHAATARFSRELALVNAKEDGEAPAAAAPLTPAAVAPPPKQASSGLFGSLFGRKGE